MALAEKLLAAEFNRAGHTVVDHHTYVFFGDGCLMEGISHEASALAGAWKLDKLIALYDDNGISIDGAVAPVVHRRHAEALRGLRLARDRRRRRPRRRGGRRGDREGARQHRQADPDLLQDDDRQGRADARRHRQGARRSARRRRGQGDARRARLAARAVRPARRGLCRLGRHAPAAPLPKRRGGESFAAYAKAFPELAAEYTRRMAGELPASWPKVVAATAVAAHAKAETVASRKASQIVLESFTAGAARAARRQRRPDRLEPHQYQAARRRSGSPATAASSRTPRAGAAATSTTACASSAWRRS